jgi:dihydrodipicolinate synthase/N-acetylneuraminate lyase
MSPDSSVTWLEPLRRGVVIPACPLALDASRKFDEDAQRRLLRYYFSAGAGGLAVGVHTTQFALREPQHNLFKTILRVAGEEMDRTDQIRQKPLIRVGGVCGETRQALAEAELLRECGYQTGLLSLSAMKQATESEVLEHCRLVSEVIPLFGFYLQPAVGGRLLPYSFWRQFAEIENVVAIKIAPFNRYQTIDVIRAVVDAGRDDIALYTGNDDNIVVDLLSAFRFRRGADIIERRIAGGLLGQWAVGTNAAVRLLEECQQVREQAAIPQSLLQLANDLTDLNAAVFDAANGFHGCIAGIHEVLRRQGLLKGTWCLDPQEGPGPGQAAELDRVWNAYPELLDREFLAGQSSDRP